MFYKIIAIDSHLKIFNDTLLAGITETFVSNLRMGWEKDGDGKGGLSQNYRSRNRNCLVTV